MRSFHFSRRILIVVALAGSTSTVLAASVQARQHLEQFKTLIRQNWGGAYVARVRLHPRDDALVNITANKRWNTLKPHQKLALGRKWWARWAKLRNRDERYVVVDVKTSNGYPLLHCYGAPWQSGTCK